ncbi:hypothetical protein FRC09_006795 [Ceratobasidium sp. 395]|nr:hypothetical protein FRC09_006795 [Ceratobasidium sp. 395]
MEIQEDKIPEIKIGGFVFADQQPPLGQTNDTQVPVFELKVDIRLLYQTNLQDNIRAGYQAGFDFRRPEAYERMAADKLGQELAQDATIWKLYLEEADEHDQELVKGRHASLDMLLLFAALFSAILTAFLIESKDLLQQDPADLSVALMFTIAQSQYRMEQGKSIALNATAIPPTIPTFTPPTIARWINGIWFTSLALSLSAALVAMLGKEWLTAFLASRPRPAHAHALLRQSRLEGLEQWWALHIIALLPSLLHASLLLFAIGLVLYLSTMDRAIAVVIASIVGITSLFYIVTAILGAIYTFCPFVTELSKYVQRVTVLLLRRAGAKSDTPNLHPLLKDIQALLWLANNARDPAVVDCSYQALSGLPPPANERLDPSAIPPENNSAESPQNELPMILSDDTTLNTLLASTISRFERLAAGSLDMLGSPELSVARYMSAIMRILEHTRYSEVVLRAQLVEFSKSLNPSRHTPSGMATPVKLNNEHSQVTLFQLLNTTETIWGNSSLPRGTDTYASVLVLTANMFQLAISFEFTEKPGAQHEDKSDAHVNVEIISPNLTRADSNNQLADLRAHYSRWLARVTTLLKLHNDSKVTIKSPFLDDLLEAITILARSRSLNPVHCMSSHHPQPGNSAGRTFSIAVASNKGNPSPLQPNDLCTGPLSGLIGILAVRPGMSEESPSKTCLAALKAYSALAPVLLQQVLGLSRDELGNEFERDDWESGRSSDMRWLRFIAVRLALLTTRHLVLSSKLVSSNHLQFWGEVILLVNQILLHDTADRSEDARSSLVRYGADLVPFLELINESGQQILSATSSIAQGVLVGLAGLQVYENEASLKPTNLCEARFTPKCFPPLIELVGQTIVPVDHERLMLQAMVRRMRGNRPGDSSENGVPAVEYLRSFTSTSQGFSALIHARNRTQYIEMIEETVVDITHLAAGQDPLLTVEQIELQAPAVSGFLDVVSAVAPHLAEPQSDQKQLIQFSNDSLSLMKVAVKDAVSRELMSQHSACQDLWKAIQTIKNKTQREHLIKMCLDAQSESGVEFKSRFKDRMDMLRVSALIYARDDINCVEVVEETTRDIIHLAAGQDPLLKVEEVELQPPVVPGFLDVVSAVVQHLAESTSSQTQLIQFSSDSLDLVKIAVKDPALRKLIRQPSACEDSWKATHAVKDKTQRQDLIERVLDEELGVEFEVIDLRN